jgi:Sulfotransferase family
VLVAEQRLIEHEPKTPPTEEPPPPVFLFGFERSGTTLLSMMIGGHPRIAVPFSVTGLWYRYGNLLDRYNGLGTADDVTRLVDDLLQEERIRLWDIELTRDEVLEGLEPGSYPHVIARFHSLYAQHKGKDLWSNIDIATLNDMDQAHLWFPEARFVHIVRDGRDVALSHETYPYGAANIAECASAWMHQLQVSLKMGAILGPQRYLVVRYEDLVLESEATLQRLCAFMGVVYSPKMLEYPSMVEEKVPASRRWLWPTLDKPPVKSNAYRWKTQMSTTKRIVFEGIARSMLAALGYEVYSQVPKRMGAYLLELWYFLGQSGRFRRLAAKFGLRRPTPNRLKLR